LRPSVSTDRHAAAVGGDQRRVGSVETGQSGRREQQFDPDGRKRVGVVHRRVSLVVVAVLPLSRAALFL